jgi:pimeloyl-ACP methyl ester carboxylesterase
MSITLDDLKIARFYEGVPEDQLERLKAFRSRFPYKEMQGKGHVWRYIDTREGDPTIFILAGGTTVAEISFNTIEHLAQKYRVIAPDYPAIQNLKDLFRGYLEMGDWLGVERFVLMGGSYGGWLAQSFVRYAPERIDKLVLSAIGPPNPENSRQLARMLWLLRLMPIGVLRALMNRSFTRLAGEGELEPERVLMMAQLKEIMFAHVGRKDILAALIRLIDQTENYDFSPNDLKEWSGRILILMGAEDPSTPPDKREAMATLYPQAKVMVFEGADHTMALTHRQAYYSAIDDFLARKKSPS